jgi:hypothetical protein
MSLDDIAGPRVTLIMFIGFISATFIAIGKAARATDRPGHRAEFAMVWAVGAAMFVHCISFFGVSYFGQILLLLVLIPAIAASLAEITATAHGSVATQNHSPASPPLRTPAQSTSFWR